jgi:hypothetical protein
MEIAPPRPSLLLHVRLLRLAMRRLVLNLDQSTALAVQRVQQRMAIFAASSSVASGAVLYGYLPHPAAEPPVAVGPSSVSRLHAFPLATAALAMADDGGRSQLDAQQGQQQQQQQQKKKSQRRKLFIERLRLDTLTINLSLSRPRESPDEVRGQPIAETGGGIVLWGRVFVVHACSHSIDAPRMDVHIRSTWASA